MHQAKFTLSEEQLQFVSHFQSLGFPDKSSLVREAIERFRDSLAQDRLRRSADLYAEVYAGDDELQELTELAIEDWPE